MKTRIIYFLIIICWACTSSESKFEAHQTALEQVDPKIKDNYDVIVVIPRAGCTGCIDETTSFFLKHVQQLNQRSLIILTEVGDQKLLKIRLGEAFLESSRVLIDQDNYFTYSGVDSVYPQMIILNDGLIQDVKVFDKQEFEEKYL